MNLFSNATIKNMQNGKEVSVAGNGSESDVTLSMAIIDGKRAFFLSTYACVEYVRSHMVESQTFASIAAAKRFVQG
jgi:hypothetical protein